MFKSDKSNSSLFSFQMMDNKDYRTSGQWRQFVNLERYQEAVKNGQLELCRQIVATSKERNPRCKNGWTPLHWASRAGQYEICRFILDGSDVEKNPPNVMGCTPLHIAALKGHANIFKLIADQVKDKNPADETGRTPLHWAAKDSHAEICKIIVESDSDLSSVNTSGETPLHIARSHGHSDIVELLEAGLETRLLKSMNSGEMK